MDVRRFASIPDGAIDYVDTIDREPSKQSVPVEAIAMATPLIREERNLVSEKPGAVRSVQPSSASARLRLQRSHEQVTLVSRRRKIPSADLQLLLRHPGRAG
jgi:hypothetical protein